MWRNNSKMKQVKNEIWKMIMRNIVETLCGPIGPVYHTLGKKLFPHYLWHMPIPFIGTV